MSHINAHLSFDITKAAVKEPDLRVKIQEIINAVTFYLTKYIISHYLTCLMVDQILPCITLFIICIYGNKILLAADEIM